MKAVYDLVKDVYQGEAMIPLNKRNAKFPEKLPASNLISRYKIPDTVHIKMPAMAKNKKISIL